MNPLEERFPRLWAVAERVSVIVLGGFLFWLFSAFVVTLPAAITALFATVAVLIRPASGDTFGRFWRGFRRSFGRALMLGVLDAALGIILYVDIRFFWAMGTTFGKVLTLLLASITGLVVMVNVYAWPLLAWYPQPMGALLRRAFLLTAAHPLATLVGLAGSAVALFLMLLLPGALLGLAFILGPGTVALILGFSAWNVMKRYAGSDDEFAE